VREDGQNRQLRIVLCHSRVVDDGHRRRADDQGRQGSARAQVDGRAAPAGHGVARRDDQDARGTLEPGAKACDVGWPCEPLAVVALQLHLEDDAEHGLAVDQEDDQVGAVLGGRDVRQVGRLEADGGVGRQRDVKGVAQQLGRELWAVAEEEQQRFVGERRHRGGAMLPIGRARPGVAPGRGRRGATVRRRPRLRRATRIPLPALPPGTLATSAALVAWFGRADGRAGCSSEPGCTGRRLGHRAEMRFPRPDARFASLALGTVLVVSFAACGLRQFGRWSGDAVIHLAVAERAAAGEWFAFNPGETASATTSLAWVALEAMIMRVSGVNGVLLAVPWLALAALLATALLVGRLARRGGAPPDLAWLGALAFLGLPGVAYNGMLGMECGAFAALAVAFLSTLFTLDRASWRATTPALGVLLGVAVLVRPEGVLLAVALVADVASARSGTRARSSARALLVVTLAGALVAPALAFQHLATGHWLPTSAMSRLMAARRAPDSVHLVGPVWLYGAPFVRALAYAPLFGCAALAVVRDPLADARILRLRTALGSTLACAFLCYGAITGAAQVARYLAWALAIASALAPIGLARLLAWRHRARSLVVASAAFWFVGVLVSEAYLRRGMGNISTTRLRQNVADRREVTDALLGEVCAGGCCVRGRPPRIAAYEVQIRFWLDNRVDVASMDGRTSAARAPLRFDAEGCPDLEPLLSDPAVVAVAASEPVNEFETPDA